MRFGLILLLAVFVQGLNAGELKLENVQKLVASGQYSAGLETLQSMTVNTLNPDLQSVWYFGKGLLSFKQNQWKQAKGAFQKAVALNTVLDSYSYYHLGLIEKKLGQPQLARTYLNKAHGLNPSKIIKYEIRLALAELAVDRGHYRTAYRHYRYLQKRWKWSDNYPMILKHLVEVDLKRRKKWRACRWARNLYRNFPSHPSAEAWGIDLQNVEVAGVKIGCLASFNDQKRRIRRLQWAGQSQRARQEIDILIKRSSKSTKYNVDKLLANFLMNEGYVDEAVQVLLKYYDQNKSDFEYLELLGKATAKAGRFQTAVGSYYKAHKAKSWRTRDSRDALFRAAFLSYQFQDYDGAYRKFKRVVKLYPRSWRARDARWHLAWLKYLRSDYPGAIADFKAIKSRAKRRRRYWRKYPMERIHYWLGMSYYRSGQQQLARNLFLGLVEQSPFNYYAQAAKSRLLELPERDDSGERRIAGEDGAAVKAASEDLSLSANMDLNSQEPEAEEVEDAIKDEAEDIAKNEVPVDDEDDEEPLEKEEPIFFQSKSLQKKFTKAKELIALGLYGLAKWELYGIERKTRNDAYRRQLIKLYEEIEAFNRSAYISTIYFGSERNENGIEKRRELWKAAYPLAYNNVVSHFASEFNVEKEFILSVMRAESLFKADISSPVGAKGLMQLMPHTATQVSRLLGDESFNGDFLIRPEVNIRMGSRYLHRLSKKFKGQIPLMAAGYNAGPHRVESWLASFGHLEMDEFIEHIPFKETRNYVKKVTQNYVIYKRLYAGESKPLAWLNRSISIPPNIQHTARETWERL